MADDKNKKQPQVECESEQRKPRQSQEDSLLLVDGIERPDVPELFRIT